MLRCSLGLILGLIASKQPQELELPPTLRSTERVSSGLIYLLIQSLLFTLTMFQKGGKIAYKNIRGGLKKKTKDETDMWEKKKKEHDSMV